MHLYKITHFYEFLCVPRKISETIAHKVFLYNGDRIIFRLEGQIMNVIVQTLKVSQLNITNYCYVILDESSKKAIIVDPAWQFEIIEKKLKDNNSSLLAILLTHSHFDHVNLAGHLAKKHKCMVFMSKIEIEYYRFRCPNLIAIEEFGALHFSDFAVLPILTPGHTKGGLCYLIENNLFTGDTLFFEGCGICIGNGADPNDMFDSVLFLKHNIPLKTRVYPGHSYGQEPGPTFGYLIENNIYMHFRTRRDFIAYRMRDNQHDIFRFA